MPAKLKPSTKEYVKDARGKMTNKFIWKHFTPNNTSTVELQKMYKSDSFKRKKTIIKRELEKRNAL